MILYFDRFHRYCKQLIRWFQCFGANKPISLMVCFNTEQSMGFTVPAPIPTVFLIYLSFICLFSLLYAVLKSIRFEEESGRKQPVTAISE